MAVVLSMEVAAAFHLPGAPCKPRQTLGGVVANGRTQRLGTAGCQNARFDGRVLACIFFRRQNVVPISSIRTDIHACKRLCRVDDRIRAFRIDTAGRTGWGQFLDVRRMKPSSWRAGRTCLQNTGTPEGTGGSGNNNSETSKSICRTLELSFRKVWLRLYTSGADENYSLALKEFVQAAVAAFDDGYSLQALMLELRRHEIETGDPMVDKTVRLTDQERQTREVWLVLVYLTLHRVKYASKKVPLCLSLLVRFRTCRSSSICTQPCAAPEARSPKP